MDDILKDIKILLGIDVASSTEDNILNIYINRAAYLIKNHLNNDAFDDNYVKNTFKTAIVQLVYDGYSAKGEEAVKQKTQGSRSVIYKDNLGMNISSVVDLLPLPYAKMR